jgi:hypothetical protein
MPAVQETKDDTMLLVTAKVANAIFNLLNNQPIVLYYQAAVGFSPTETSWGAVQAGNYATWPGLTTQLVNKHFPNSDGTQKGHMKGQRQGV